MLEEVKRSYIKAAALVKPDWKTTDVNTLCNLYIDHEDDEVLRDGYFAGVVLKKWGYIGKHYINSKASGFTIEDCYIMVTDAVMYILKSRKWRDPSNKLYGDKNAPDKCLNRCIFSARQRDYYLANRQKRKADFGGNKVSLSYIEDQVGDHSEVFMTDDDQMCTIYSSDVKNIISLLLNNNRGLEGIILDNILHDDCFVTKSETLVDVDGNKFKKSHEVFKLCKLVDNLSRYDDNSIKKLCNSYGVSSDKGNQVLDIIKQVDKNKLSRIVKATIEKMSNDKTLKEALCY